MVKFLNNYTFSANMLHAYIYTVNKLTLSIFYTDWPLSVRYILYIRNIIIYLYMYGER